MTKKGFTLIELLAVIIILGVLMIIAIPSVTKYINDSRKSGYVSTAKNIVGGARNLVYSGQLDISDKDITYYIDGDCIKTDNGLKSPYGDITKSYVAVVLDGDNYEYFWMSVDSTNTGVNAIKSIDKLENDDIVGDIDPSTIEPNIGIDKRKTIVKIEGENCVKSDPKPATRKMNTKTGKIGDPCPSVTETIYWALQNPNSNGKYQKLVISDAPVSGGESGNFPGNSTFAEYSTPWYNYDTYYVSEVEIVGTVAPLSISNWFSGMGQSASSVHADLSNLEVCNVVSMDNTFANFGEYSRQGVSLEGIENWDTSSVTNMSDTFASFATNNTENILNLSNWDTSSVVDMSSMFGRFGRDSSIVSLNLSNWDTSNVTDMESMFSYSGVSATSWTLIGLDSWDVSNVYNMNHMFSKAAQNVTTFSLNLSGWNASKVTDMSYMFYENATEASEYYLNVSGWNTSSVTRMNYMFYQAGNLATTWSIVGVDSWDTSNVIYMGSLFQTASNAESVYLDLSNWNTSNVIDMGGMFTSFGYYSSSFNVIIPKTNGADITNTTKTMFGKNQWTNATFAPDDSRSFIIAN